MNFENVLACDIETTGLNHKKDKITCIGVYNDDYKRVFRDLKEFYDFVQNTTYYFVGHKFIFDMRFLYEDGVHVPLDRWLACTQNMASVYPFKVSQEYLEWYEGKRKEVNKLLPPGVSHRQARSTSLKVLAPFWLGVEPFWEDPSNHDDDDYVLKDCEYTFRLFRMFHEKLKEQGCSDFYYNKVQRWAQMLFETEVRGIKINQDQFEALERQYKAEEIELRQQIDGVWAKAHEQYYVGQVQDLEYKYSDMAVTAMDKLKDKTKEKLEKTATRYMSLKNNAIEKLDKKINYASDKQMLWLLRDYLGYDCTNFEGKESTGKEVLEKLADQGNKDVGLFLKWRKTQKINTSYFPSYRELQTDWTIYPSFNLAGTRTGRLSSSDPNFQQVPPKLYSMFMPRPGYKFVQYDLSGIEAALIALYSDDKALYDIIVSGESIHNVNAKVDLELDCDVSKVKELYPVERQAAKNSGFACFYGAGSKRIQATYQSAGISLPLDRCKTILKNRKKFFQGVFDFHKEVTAVFESGEIVTNLLGRPLYIPDPKDAYMKGFNTLVQSSASDLNIRAAEKTIDECKQRGLDAHLLALVHDFILIEAHEDIADEVDEILVRNMTGFNLECSHGKIPLQVEGCVDEVWRK